MDITQRKKDRFLFLKQLYNISGGDMHANCSMNEIGQQLGFDNNYLRLIADYLIMEGLAASRVKGGYIAISHYGIKEVEEALENPDKPTQHFLPINIINIGSMTNSSLQQATNKSTIHFTFEEKTKDELNSIIDSIKGIQDTLNVSSEILRELQSEILTLESQSSSPKPKNIIISESLRTIRTILESVTGNAMTPLIVDQIGQLLK